MASITSTGATAYPSRHPVIAKLLENPSMITVRSAMPGSDQMDLYSPLNKMRA